MTPRPDFKVDPKKIFAHLFPGLDPTKLYYSDTVAQGETSRFIDSLSPLQSSKMDEAGYGLL